MYSSIAIITSKGSIEYYYDRQYMKKGFSLPVVSFIYIQAVFIIALSFRRSGAM